MTWADIYLKWVKKGVDHAFAAHKADLWEKRRAEKIERLRKEVAALEGQANE